MRQGERREAVEPASRLPAQRRHDQESAVVDPRDSDLWLEQFEGTGSITVALDLPEDVSLIVATDGTAPAASDIRVSWPVDTATPPNSSPQSPRVEETAR